MVRAVARAVWALPVLLTALSANQARVAWNLHATWQSGELATARVLAFESSNRAFATYGSVDLHVRLAAGTEITRTKLSLPQSLWHGVEGRDSLDVHVRPGAPQEIVIARLMPGHYLIAASQAGMSLLGALMLVAGAWAWNAHLRRNPAPSTG